MKPFASATGCDGISGQKTDLHILVSNVLDCGALKGLNVSVTRGGGHGDWGGVSGLPV